MTRYENGSARVGPGDSPVPARRPGGDGRRDARQSPLLLFTTLARDPRLFHKFFAGGLLDLGNVTIRQREIVIDRVTATCGAEYEWGVHVSVYADKVGPTRTRSVPGHRRSR